MNRKLFWIFSLSAAVYFTQGVEGLPSQALFYYLKETLNFPPQKIMLLSSVIIGAWLVKPLIGYIIDNFLTKKAWIFIALTFDVILVLIIGLLKLPLFMLIFILVVNSANTAFRDVGVDGIMCVEGKKYNATGRIQSIQWIAISFSGIITGIGGGYIAEKLGYQAGYLFLVPFYIIASLAAHFYKEEGSTKNLNSSGLLADMKKIFANKQLLLLGLFIFLYRYSPSFGTPLWFMQRDVFGWSKVWIGAMATIGTLFEIGGALLYYKFSQRINIKKWLYGSVFLGAVVSLSYLYYTPLTAVIYNIIYGLVGMFIFIMVMDFMARNTISGLEATSFALLCSISNLALVASSLSGAWLLPVLGLKWLIVISAFTSFLCLPLIKKI